MDVHLPCSQAQERGLDVHVVPKSSMNNPVIVHVFVCLQGLNFQLAAVLLSIGIYAYIESGRSTYMTRIILCSNLCECNKVAPLHSQGVHVNSCLCDIQERKQYRHNGKIEIEKSFMI